ncbi:MAG: VTT domain-containing protein, partial [Spirochaetia bacterium]|nr:VTT domain-containing protein [Spirochaetia bacterium]
YLLTLRFIPIFPFFLVNLLAGVTSVKALTFIWTTALGIIPGSFVYSYLGYAGASLKPGETDFPYEVLIALVLLGLLSLVPVAVKKRRNKKSFHEEIV